MDILQYLLELGFDVDTDDSDTAEGIVETALCCAAKRGLNTAVRFLVEHGADLNPIREGDPITVLPLREAMDDERIDTVKHLLVHMDLTTLPNNYYEQAMLICVAAASGSGGTRRDCSSMAVIQKQLSRLVVALIGI